MSRLACLLLALGFSLVLRAAPPNDSVVTFNEIHYHPNSANEAGEFIELINEMAVNVDISRWKITGGVEYQFGDNVVIPSGGTIVVAKTAGMYPGAKGPFSGSLNNSGETLRLRDNNNRVMDEMTYEDGGTWPVAADGSGVSLAKRNPYANSSEAASWVTSAQAGGTPGGPNFPGPPGPITSRMFERDTTWKYNASGAAPANWNTVAFNDAAWSSGQASLHVGNPLIFTSDKPPKPDGQWFFRSWINDATTDVASTKTYTHKIGFNRPTGFTAFNGVTFDSPGVGVLSGANWSLTGATALFNNNPANNLPQVGNNSYQLVQNFFYGATNPGLTSRLTLTGLTAGQTYTAAFYSVGYGGPGIRQVRVTPGDTGLGYLIDQNVANNGNGLIVKYRYIAADNGTMTFDFQDTMQATWHHYAFSNEVVTTPMVAQTEISAGVSAFSSELSSAPFTRYAVNCVNGLGLVNGQHGVVPEGTMWLSNGTFTAPNDPLPAEITFDLGETVDLAGFHVWNYNEATSGLMTRGANQVVVQTATAPGGPFTTATTLNFRKAYGVASEPGERFDLIAPGVRQVKFIINTSHGGDNSFAGLSEVKFFKQGLAGGGLPPYYLEPVTSPKNTGLNAAGGLATAGTGDANWTNVGTGQPAIVMVGNTAWAGFDGLSQWLGPTASGTDNHPVAQSNYRTAFSLAGFYAPGADVRFYVGADNSLDDVKVNGVSKFVSAAGFIPMIGPIKIPGPFTAGENTFNFLWSNAGPTPNPAGFRLRWDVQAPPDLGRTTLPANPVTTYLRHTFTPTGLADSTYQVLLDFVADDGAVFYLNGSEVLRVNLPDGAITAATLASKEIVYPQFSGFLEVPANALLPNQPNVLAVELHQASAGNADALFMARLDVVETLKPVIVPSVRFNEIAGASAGNFFVEIQNNGTVPFSLAGYQVRSASGQVYTFGATNLAVGALFSVDQATLGFRPANGDKLFLASPTNGIGDGVEVKNAGQARTNAGAWQVPSAGTPGAGNTFALNTTVVINEIMYNHQPVYAQTGTTDVPEEWVELYNRTALPVSLTGWKLRGGMDFDFAAGTEIPANGYLVIANDPAALLAKFSGINVVGPGDGSLSNSDDIVRLEDAVGNTVNEVHYFDEGRWDGRADGNGGSLELRNPNMDNTVPEAWQASDETARSAWTTISYSGPGASFAGTNDPTLYQEFILGLINGGECLVDDVSVQETTPNNRQLIQNGNFSSGTTAWRNRGNHGGHGRSIAVPDPSAPGNNVMRIVGTGPTEHMHNCCETTLAGGAVASPSANYVITFRARWLSGCPRLLSRLYFNRLTKHHLLPVPMNNGTPGAPNSRFTALTGPTFSGLTQSAAVPEAGQAAVLRVAVADPQGVASVAIKWKIETEANWNSAPMTVVEGAYQGEIPGQAANALVQFYLEASDGATLSTFPAAGPNARAFIRWKDGELPARAGHGMRILMSTADANFMHNAINAMSNDYVPCTVVYRESEVFYGAKVHIKSSQRGRVDDKRLGFALEFDPMKKFRGAHTGINLDRSGYGRGSGPFGHGHGEIATWHMFNRAGGIPSMYNDMVYIVAPRTAHTGSGILTMAEFNDVWLDSQYDNGAAFPVFKYELIYFPLSADGNSYKLAQPDDVRGVEFGSIFPSTTPAPEKKEAFRWNFLIGNARANDDYSRLINMSDTFRLSGAAFNSAIVNAIDVDQWLRASAAMALAGVADSYATSSGAWHNLKLYNRPDGRMLYVPWDLDYQLTGAGDAIVINPDIQMLLNISFVYERQFYQHLLDIMDTSFNPGYIGPWATHYSTFDFSGGIWDQITSYYTDRGNYVRGLITAKYGSQATDVFDITSPDTSTSGSTATISGTGSLRVRTIAIEAGGLVLPVTWTSANTWQVTVPISPGQNTIKLLAYDYQGNLRGSDTINITGTGGNVPATASKLVISEIHYHPLPPSGTAETSVATDKDEFEFIEIRNITAAQTVSLAGCRLIGGVDYTFPNVTLAPGAYAVVPRNTAAFAARYQGVATLPQYYFAGGNFLSNSGDVLTLIAADGSVISQVDYKDSGSAKWPASPDGSGRSLVLIAPLTNPDTLNPLHWRASAANHGNPGAGDAIAPIADPEGDSNGNGVKNLVEHAIGLGAFPKAGAASVVGQRHLTFTLERNPLTDSDWNLEGTADLAQPFGPVNADYEITARTLLPNGVERVTLRSINPSTATGTFLRGKIRVP